MSFNHQEFEQKKQQQQFQIHQEEHANGLIEVEAYLDPAMMEQEQKSREEQRLTDTRKTVEEQAPAKLGFLTIGKNLLDRNYRLESGKKWKLFNSRRMRAVKKYLTQINRFTQKKVDPETFDRDLEEIQEFYLKLVEKCNKYIDEKDPGTEEGRVRMLMVRDILLQAREESVMLESAARQYQREGIKKGDTWAAILGVQRTRTFTHGKDGVKITKGGGLSSDLLIIEQGDGSKLYFKKEESRPRYDFKHVAQTRLTEYEEEYHRIQKGEGPYQELPEEKKKELLEKNENHRTILTQLRSAVEQGMRHQKDKVIANMMIDLYYHMIKQPETPFYEQEKFQNFLLNTLDGTEFSRMVRSAVRSRDTEHAKEFLKDVESAFLEIGKTLNLALLAKEELRIEEGDSISKRNVATARVAKLLGLSDLVVKTEMAEVNINGVKMKGILMDDAGGEGVFDVFENREDRRRRPEYSPEAIRQVLNLQILDILCGQIDRNQGNYRCGMRRTKGSLIFSSIIGIDNDLCFGNLSYVNLFSVKNGERYMNLPNLESGRTHGGVPEIYIPVMDALLANQIEALTPEMLEFALVDLLSKDEIQAAKSRLRGLKNLVRGMKKRDKTYGTDSFLLGENSWKEFHREVYSGTDRRLAEELIKHTYLEKAYLKPHVQKP